MTSRWYVVQTQPHAESKAMGHLARQGFAAYLPRYLKRHRHAQRIESVYAPLFPRYLFVAIDPMTQRWRSIQSTIGVAHLVCSGEDPAPAGIISKLRDHEGERGLVHHLRPRFAPGDKILVVDGIFGASLGMADRERVAILLDRLYRKVRVVLDEDAIAAA